MRSVGRIPDMQTRDAIKGLYNFSEFSQCPSGLDEAI